MSLSIRSLMMTDYDDFMDYPLWEQRLEEDIQGIFDRRLNNDTENAFL